MAVLDILSNHFQDKEYLRDQSKDIWDEDPVIKAIFERFNGRLRTMFDLRNVMVSVRHPAVLEGPGVRYIDVRHPAVLEGPGVRYIDVRQPAVLEGPGVRYIDGKWR
ncbi:hypothetical protein FEM48_Zijuj10G0112800 [Ziziphus jujuba var. spinosa]|uniref:Lipoxygenase domain-containing protein n=1 Tax=Ziziphus jujuba var. spinosa TaxID=714518 RepID=A0A978UN24_ZIZJJ|nr:hypothetical protein FEM48_Zijuj10G0112800 [Ziziphus jujuba var. spinosa]